MKKLICGLLIAFSITATAQNRNLTLQDSTFIKAFITRMSILNQFSSTQTASGKISGGFSVGGTLNAGKIQMFGGYNPDAGQLSIGNFQAIGANASDRDRAIGLFTGSTEDWRFGENASKKFFISRPGIDSTFTIDNATGNVKLRSLSFKYVDPATGNYINFSGNQLTSSSGTLIANSNISFPFGNLLKWTSDDGFDMHLGSPGTGNLLWLTFGGKGGVPNSSNIFQFSVDGSGGAQIYDYNNVLRFLKQHDNVSELTNDAGYITSPVASTTYESLSNKVTTLDNSNAHYPSTSAVTTVLSTKQNSITFTTTGTGAATLTGGNALNIPTPTFANSTALSGLTAVNGSATTFMRSDAAPAIDQTISPTWSGIHNFSNKIGLGTTSPTHTITLANGTNGIVTYNTTDQVTNYERGKIYWGGNVYTISAENGGTGLSRDIAILAGASALYMGPNTYGGYSATFKRDGTTNSLFQITSTGLQSSTSNQYFLALDPQINQSGTAGYSGLLISPFENTTGSGPKYLINAGTNTAAATAGTHTAKFTVDNTGVTTATQFKVSALNTAPSTSTSTGTTGEIRITSGFIYVCTATNTWVRAALSTF